MKASKYAEVFVNVVLDKQEQSSVVEHVASRHNTGEVVSRQGLEIDFEFDSESNADEFIENIQTLDIILERN